MLESQPHFLAIGEDELVEIEEYKLERLGVGLVDLDDLRDAARVEGLVLYVAEVTEDFLDLVLHVMLIITGAEYLSNPQNAKLLNYRS